MNNLPKDIKLVIFDLDGTLINSTSLWHDIDIAFFAKRGMIPPSSYGKEIAHLGLEKAAVFTKEHYFPNESEEDILNEWKEMSLEAYQNTITIKNHAKELIELLASKGIIITLATANSKSLYEPCLKRLGIYDYFSYVIDVNACKQGKNSTEIYDKIVTKFNVHKDEVIIFEDLLEPQRTAFNGDYFVVGVYDEHSVIDRKENQKYCSMYIDDMSQFIEVFLQKY